MFEESVDLMAAAEALEEYWSPKVVAQVNDQYVKVAKLRGSLVRHRHKDQDELLYLLRGNLTIEYEGGGAVHLQPGSICTVPKGVLYIPIALQDCWIVLIESVRAKPTGEVDTTPLTKTIEQQLT